MSDNRAIDPNSNAQIHKDLFIKTQVSKYFTISLLLIIINIFLFNLMFPENLAKHSNVKMAIWLFGVSIPFMSFVLAYGFNFISYRNFSYSERYLRTSLITICTIETFSMTLSAFYALNGIIQDSK